MFCFLVRQDREYIRTFFDIDTLETKIDDLIVHLVFASILDFKALQRQINLLRQFVSKIEFARFDLLIKFLLGHSTKILNENKQRFA